MSKDIGKRSGKGIIGVILLWMLCLSLARLDLAGKIVCAGSLYAQTEEKEPAPETAREKEAQETNAKGKSFLWFVKAGGVFMWPICLGSILALALMIEHFITLKIPRYIPPTFVQQVKENIAQGNIEGAKDLCQQKAGPLPEVIKAAIGKFGHGRADMEKIAGEVGYRKALALNTKVSYLSWIAVLEPMWGLLGTVQGLIQAFMVIAEKSGMANPRALASGVYAALITTAAGLLVAIPSMSLYFWFKSVANKIMTAIEETASEIIELLIQKEKEGIPPPAQNQGLAPAGRD